MKRAAVYLLIGAGAIAALAFFYRMQLAAAGLRVTSWFRHPWKNEKVGGVANSRHQLGLAFDVVPVTPGTLEKLRQIGFRKIINEGDHYHVEVV